MIIFGAIDSLHAIDNVQGDALNETLSLLYTIVTTNQIMINTNQAIIIYA